LFGKFDRGGWFTDFARRAFASRSAKNKTFYCKCARLSAAAPTVHEKPVARFSGILIKYFYPSNLTANLRLESEWFKN